MIFFILITGVIFFYESGEGDKHMIDCIEKKQCTGCKLCGDICPNHAIVYEEDNLGFWYPKVDSDKCTKCGLCKKKCPAINNIETNTLAEPEVYAAWSKDTHIRHESTSGGVFWEIAASFIKAGGVVVGAAYGNDWKHAKHAIARNTDELSTLRGSKYFQSDTEGIYNQVKAELNKGKKVLFCGTPCQNAALHMLFGNEIEGIYFVDFICRNINSPKAFSAYLSELEDEFDSQVSCVQLKNKRFGWQSLATKVVFENGQEKITTKEEDYWVNGFIGKDLYTRESCSACRYRELPRKTADITIGDFWGIKNESSYEMFQGISVVLINTLIGKRLWSENCQNLVIKEKDISDVVPGNPALYRNPVPNPRQKDFFDLLSDHKFSDAYIMTVGDIKQHKSRFDKVNKIAKDIAERKKEKEIDILQYIYLNYFCKNVVHNGRGKIVPYKNAVIELHNTAQLIINGNNDLKIGVNKLKKSKAETYFRMARDSVCVFNHGGLLYFNTLLDIKENAIFETGFFNANSGSCIVVTCKTQFGEDVMLGRNIMVYDSDFHQICDERNTPKNEPQPILIEDHVWLTGNVTVLRGTKIGANSIVSAYSQVSKDIMPWTRAGSDTRAKEIGNASYWNRTSVKRHKDIMKDSRIILFGYGEIGKIFARMYSERVDYIVDNNVKDDNVVSFDEFYRKNKELPNGYIWVIAAPKYFEELYACVRKRYPTVKIFSATDII